MRKTIIITGANGNLGTAVTNYFLSDGYMIVATVHAEEAKKDLPSHENLQVEAVDLTNEDAATAFVQNVISQHPKVDGALLLVGGFAMGNIEATSINDIRKQISLNFETAYHVARPLFRHLKQNGQGRIVFIGARPAIDAKAGKNMVAYGLSKSLLFTLADYLNAEAKGTNVTATVVVPSTIDTAPNRSAMPDANPDAWVKPEALAAILEFVLSEKASPLRETVFKVYNNA
ncbi:MAG TPA: SDR family NAD(P)-dependent oxidoreductase [Flavisolibacter sp.]|nr:SDR family NAD(P)-dependent oxidoreductase [Flavisolibacter sp.]